MRRICAFALLLCFAMTACIHATPSATSEPMGETEVTTKATTKATTTTMEESVTTELAAVTTTTTAVVPETTTAVTTQATTRKATKATTKATTKKTSQATAKPTTKKTSKVTAPTQPSGSQVTDAMLVTIRDEFMRLVNLERQRVGKTALASDNLLNTAAAIRAEEIIAVFSHTRPNGSNCFTTLDEVHYHHLNAGENIAMSGFNPDGFLHSDDVFTGSQEQLFTIAANAFTQFKNSPGHYQNMISPDFTEHGVGISWCLHKDLGIPAFYTAHFFGTPMT